MLWLDWLVDAAKRPGEGFGEFSWTLPKGELVAGHKVPHLRWSQAPPLPWLRPGSADFMLFARHAIILVGNLFKGIQVSFGFMEMVHRMLNTSLFVVVIRFT